MHTMPRGRTCSKQPHARCKHIFLHTPGLSITTAPPHAPHTPVALLRLLELAAATEARYG